MALRRSTLIPRHAPPIQFKHVAFSGAEDCRSATAGDVLLEALQ